MLRYVLVYLLVVGPHLLSAQYFQQDISYDIVGDYDENSHVVSAAMSVQYTNQAQHSLDTIYLHLWVNAYSSKQSPYTEQQIKLGSTAFYFATEDKMGGYLSLSVQVAEEEREVQYLGVSNERAYILLPKQLEPGSTVELSISYELRMPYMDGRFGWFDGGVQLIHWHPSVALYDMAGWHTMDYLSLGELHNPLATYEVDMKLPFSSIVSSSPIDGTKRISDIRDFAIVGRNGMATVSTDTCRGVEVSLLSGSESLLSKYGHTVVREALEYFTKVIGPFPYSKLAVAEHGSSGGMEYGAFVTVTAKDTNTLRYYIVHEVLHQWFYGSVASDQRKAAWMDEGLTTYYQQRYYRDYLGQDYYSSILPSIWGINSALPIGQQVAATQGHRQFHQPLCTHIQHTSILNYGVNAYEVPARWFEHMQGYLGQDIFDKAMQRYVKEWQGRYPDADDLQYILEDVSGKKLDWFFADVVTGDWSVDYVVKKAKGNTLIVDNKGGVPAPYTLTVTDQQGNTSTQWYEGHKGARVIDSDALGVKAATLGPERGLVDRNRANNSTKGKKPRLVPGIGIDKPDYHELYALPLLSYNTSDGLVLGAALFNSTLPPKRWKYLVAPQYGLKSGLVVGQAWTSYDYYLDSPSFRKLYFRLGLKSFSDQYVNTQTLQQPLRYTKLDPTVSLHFRHAADSHRYSKLTAKAILLQNEVLLGADGSTEFQGSSIYQLRYESFNFYELSPSDLMATLEYQGYGGAGDLSDSYLKLSAIYKKAWSYKEGKQVRVRAFGSYFLANTRRTSTSYNKTIARGSVALMQQGFNDYIYEEPFLNRYNQGAGFGNQLGNYGGGFKNALGSQYSIGQSNDLALSLSTEVDLPFQLPAFLPISLYFDLGYYTTRGVGAEDLVGNTLYSGGLAFNYGEGLFSFYVPLVNSTAISDIYAIEDIGMLGRITFRFDINRFNPWEIVEDYNY